MQENREQREGARENKQKTCVVALWVACMLSNDHRPFDCTVLFWFAIPHTNGIVIARIASNNSAQRLVPRLLRLSHHFVQFVVDHLVNGYHSLSAHLYILLISRYANNQVEIVHFNFRITTKRNNASRLRLCRRQNSQSVCVNERANSIAKNEQERM